MKAPSPYTRRAVIERDQGLCIWCGRMGSNIHHRAGRGSGGSTAGWMNKPANLLVLCGTGTTGCHGWVTTHPAEARRYGLVVRRNGIRLPSEVPVFYRAEGAWIYLSDDAGRVRPANQEDVGLTEW